MGKKSLKHSEPENPDRWLVSYADFITLMFAFFAVLYATSDINLEKSKKFQESIKKYLIPFGAAGGSGAEVNQGVKENTAVDQPIKTYPRERESKTQDTLEQTEIYLEENLLKGEGKNLIQDVVAVESGVRISLNAHALFARDSVKFRREALTPLDTLCQYLSLTKRKLIIESHTEKDSLRNHSFPSQWEFAASRATAFVRFLIQRYNYPPQQLAAVSYGSERPLFAEDQSDNSKKNQRLDILVLTNDNIY